MKSFVLAGSLLCAGIGSSSDAQVCTGQVGWWRFDGDVLDSSGLGNNGVFFGGVPNFVAGVHGQALELDGLDDFVRVANAPSLNPSAGLSLVAWARIRPYSGSGSDPIIDKAYFSHSYPYYQYQLGVSGSQYPNVHQSISFVASTSAGNVGGGTPALTYATDQWCFVVGTYDGEDCRFYFNGQLFSTYTLAGTISNFGSPVQFGKFNNLGFHLPAALDDIRIFERAISADEVTALYVNPEGAAAVLPAQSGICAGGTVTLRAAHLQSASPAYVWKLDGNTLANGTLPDGTTVSGTGTASLTLSGLYGSAIRAITCEVTSCAGSATTPVATVRVCASDFNCDGAVDDSDFVDFAGAYNMLLCDDPSMPPGCPSDLNRDGLVDDSDFVLFAAAYNDLLCS
ncbi:MAG: LamG-like jellyroll fold domain-containing protein [Phycisphaerales bacterium]